MTETVYRLGGENRLAAIASYSDYPPEAAAQKPTVGGILDMDTEKILSLRPDLILSPPGAMASEKLPRLGADVVFLPDETLSDIEKSFVEIGKLVGRTDEGETLARDFSSAVEAARERAKDESPVSVLVVIGYEPLWVAGGFGFLNELVSAAGGSNVAGKIGKDFYQVDFETVLASKPQVVIDLTLEKDTPERRESVRAFWSRYPTIPAVADNRIEFVESDFLTIPGPRLVDGLAALEKILRPKESSDAASTVEAPHEAK